MRTPRPPRRRSPLLLPLLLLAPLVLLLCRAAPRKGMAGEGGGGGDMYADDAARARAIRYNRQREWLTLFGTLYGAVLSALALRSGLSAKLRDRAAGVAPARLGPVMPYTLASALLSSLATLPLSYYSGWIVERRYDLTNQTRRAWFGELLKGEALSLALGLPLAQGIYAVIRRYPRGWWAILAGLTIPFTIILSNLAPILILPFFNKFEPIRDRALAERIKALAAAQGVIVSDVLQMDMSKQTKKANAFFTGIGNTKRIVLADTLLDQFTPEEVEIVLAHELGHQVGRDIWKLIGLGALATAITAGTVDRLARPIIARSGARFGLDPARGLADVAALPLLSLLLSAVSLLLSPLQHAISRNLIEHPADRYALDLTRNPEAFVGAMEKLGRLNLADPQPPTLVKWLLYSHPTLQERIDYGRSWRAE